MASKNQSENTAVKNSHDVIYDLFILANTIYSLIMIVMLLVWPLTFATRTLLIQVDIVICIIFGFDFLLNLYRAPNWRQYFFRQGGWLDLLGSVPVIVGPSWTAVLRFARLPRMIRIMQLLRRKGTAQIQEEIRSNQPKGALLFTFLLAVVMIAVAGAVVLQVEGRSLEANIHTGGDAFWWAFVTVTTVGYGDYYPTSGLGRMMATILMTIGIGIFAVMTSYLASTFFGNDDLESLKNEIAELRQENGVIRNQLDTMIQMFTEWQQNEDE